MRKLSFNHYIRTIKKISPSHGGISTPETLNGFLPMANNTKVLKGSLYIVYCETEKKPIGNGYNNKKDANDAKEYHSQTTRHHVRVKSWK
ncbi:MAG: hypothetical protein QHC79_25585 [Pseudosphingobacterium sp.]|nr:hypothetical protein [Pseudosphingobacterium sp.]